MQMNDYIELIDKKLDDFLQIENPSSLFQSMKYTLSLPGKRLRPIMCMETCKILGEDIHKAIPTACAIEMLHVQTLIHDDLPCMDNDDYRRGKLSNHKVFGEAIATLAGDALLTYAPQIITKYSKDLSPSTIIRILNEYFHYAGARGVIAGQVVDIESENNDQISNKEETLKYLHLHKTSDLFQLAIRTGAIIANAEDETIKKLTDFAINFGYAFQIADDVLDEISTFEQMGKTIGKDKKEKKLTYVTLFGLEKAKKEISCIFQKCHAIMKEENLQSEIFDKIMTDIKKRVGI